MAAVDILLGAGTVWLAWLVATRTGLEFATDWLLFAFFALCAVLLLGGGLGFAIRNVGLARLGEGAGGAGVVLGVFLLYETFTLEGEATMAAGPAFMVSLLVLLVSGSVWWANRSARQSLSVESESR
jgi:hypothetical protein